MTKPECQMTNEVNSLRACSGDELKYWDLVVDEIEPFVVNEDAPVRVYDLEERSSAFGEQIIFFAEKKLWSPVNNRLVDQLVGAATRVGANYGEADDGVSRADFKHRISICRK